MIWRCNSGPPGILRGERSDINATKETDVHTSWLVCTLREDPSVYTAPQLSIELLLLPPSSHTHCESKVTRSYRYTDGFLTPLLTLEVQPGLDGSRSPFLCYFQKLRVDGCVTLNLGGVLYETGIR